MGTTLNGRAKRPLKAESTESTEQVSTDVPGDAAPQTKPKKASRQEVIADLLERQHKVELTCDDAQCKAANLERKAKNLRLRAKRMEGRISRLLDDEPLACGFYGDRLVVNVKKLGKRTTVLDISIHMLAIMLNDTPQRYLLLKPTDEAGVYESEKQYMGQPAIIYDIKRRTTNLEAELGFRLSDDHFA